MLNRTISLLAAVFLLAASGLVAIEKGEIYTNLTPDGVMHVAIYPRSSVFYSLNGKAVSLLTPEERAAIRQQIVTEMADEMPGIAIDAAINLMKLLGEREEGLKFLGEAFRRWDTAPGMSGYAQITLGNLARQGELDVLPLLMDGFFNGPTTSVWDGDYLPQSVSKQSALAMLEAISRSNQFSTATRAWAEQTLDRLHVMGFPQDQDLIISQFREWCEHNRAAILAGQYDRASWLPQDSPALLIRMANRQTPPDPPVRAPTSQATMPPPAVAVPTATAPMVWFATALVVLAACFGWRVLRKR